MRHIRKFVKNGTFIFVSHSINDVMSLCDHAVWLEHGRIVRMGSASEVCRAYLSSIERRNSEGFLAEQATDAAEASGFGENDEPGATAAAASSPLLAEKRATTKHLSLTADDLAALKHYYAPRPATDRISPARETWVDISEPGTADALSGDEAAVGGGRIFSVTLTDEQGKALTLACGGEIVCLVVRAVAEKPILKPILGFQLKNKMGLPLVAENTCLMTRQDDIGLQPGEIVSARFNFALPLLAVGEYVIRAGFADGVEDNNALIDVRHEALLLRCQTSGARHGLIGVPMLGIEMARDGFAEAG
jgi:lipopolysaccharide transport system ATP-binding protein